MSLTQIAIEKIKHDSDLRAKLMLVEGKSEYTLKRWINTNDDELTKPKYTNVISEHTSLDIDEILETSNVTA